MSIFKKAKANYDEDERQKGSEWDRYYGPKYLDDTHGATHDSNPVPDDLDPNLDPNFDPRQKGSKLDDYLAQNEHLIMPMKYKKPIFKIRRVH
jgi:hypothetical protein